MAMAKAKAKAAQGNVPKRVRKVDKKGLAEARKATTMTSKEWKALQVGMPKKWPAPEYMKTPHPEGKGHTCYRSETFEVVSRFQDSTRIAYRPHAKRPGSKSHARYESYAKAKTAAQALEMKSYPADWCWDIERGFLRVLGGLREDHIDMSQIQDESELTEVDRKVMGWAKKEICKKFQLQPEDLKDFLAGESLLTKAHRLVAQREAKKILSEDRAVTDDDVTKVLSMWGFAKNSNRVNVMQEGKQWVWSDTLGLLRDRIGDIHITSSAQTYPAVMQVLNRWLLDRLPPEAAGFSWTSLNLNKDYAARIHRDGNNFGPSMISAFGDFSGGHLRYYPEDDGKLDVDTLQNKQQHSAAKFDLRTGLALFNGNCAHSVEDFTGSRFSVVYFTVGCHSQMKQEERDALSALQCKVPSMDIDPFQLIKPPAGYSKSAQYRSVPTPLRATAGSANKASKRGELPGSRYWKKKDLKAKFVKSKRAAIVEAKAVPKLQRGGAAKPKPKK
mmetsp:Transcript_21300/g.49434  ORF Transcript_21300/g.49434 Transcript_21300/m.49434 type:complete len:501 (-) Transcript_21300:77-1579(-)